jgi:hypothetical protein
VSGYSRSIWFAHAGFNVDWGVPDLGHRKAIMDTEEDKTDFVEIGIGIEDVGVQPPQGQVGRYVVAEVFGVRSGVRYIVGVVYSDANTNGFYDPGEGIPGVTIMPDAGQFFAVSSSSGGYAIPVMSAAVLNITFSGGPFGTGVIRQAVVGAESVKLDAVAGRDLGAPTLVAPADGATVGSGSVEFRWNDPPGTFTHFGLEIAANATMTDPLIDTTVQTNTLTMTLPDTSRFYWRARAGNGATWGPYSEMRSFSRAPSGIPDARPSFIGELNVVPNPVYGRALVVMELPSSGVVRSTIYDAIGRPAKMLPHLLMSAGRNAATFDTDELPSGAYILECWTVSGVLRAPFVIAR